jgi:DNA-binding transcriptional regulator YdaS (Cro superfamily)
MTTPITSTTATWATPAPKSKVDLHEVIAMNAVAPAQAMPMERLDASQHAAAQALNAHHMRGTMIAATAPDGTRLHLSAHSVSGYKGVFESAGRYQAQVRVGGKQKYIGIFPTKMEAAIAVARAMGEPSDDPDADLATAADICDGGHGAATEDADMAEARDAGSVPKVEVTSTKVDDDDDDQGGTSIGPYSAKVVVQMRGPELRRAVRGAMTESGKTQTAFAIALGVNPAYLSQWLNQNWYGHSHGRPKVEKFIEERARAYLRGEALEPLHASMGPPATAVHACMGPPALGGAASSAPAQPMHPSMHAQGGASNAPAQRMERRRQQPRATSTAATGDAALRQRLFSNLVDEVQGGSSSTDDL